MADELATEQQRLNAARDRQRRQALGPPLDQSPADLDALSQVGPADLASAEAFVRDTAGPFGGDLMKATPEP